MKTTLVFALLVPAAEKASIQHQLAFVRNLQARGLTYQPQVTTSAEYIAVTRR